MVPLCESRKSEGEQTDQATSFTLLLANDGDKGSNHKKP